ncbi:MAG: hypothetical protein R6U86_00105 [Bacteroidales bacterium]
MKKMRLILALLVLFSSQHLFAAGKDTITVMAYNLLFYGQTTSFCTDQNNNVNFKDGYLRTIVSHTQPDIFAVNELGRNPANVTRILENVLNAGEGEKYAHATHTNTANSSIVNMLFYNKEKFGMHSEAVIANEVRDINLYTLYYRSPDLAFGQDTIFLSCIVVHFKAGSSSSDQQRRLVEAQAAMGYIDQNNIKGNLLFMGDFNMNSSFEQAYGLITYHSNEEIRLIDPIDKPGLWYNNPDMAPYHTQSPRTANHSCFVSGGLDDRYDQILASAGIMEGQRGMQYIDGSYATLGQDGLRYNQSLVSPPNNSEPEEVIYALYNMSDHLPVLIDIEVSPDFASHLTSLPDEKEMNISLVNPSRGILAFRLDMGPGVYEVSLYSINGDRVFRREASLDWSGQPFSYDVSFLPGGIYLLSIKGPGQSGVSRKLIMF